LWIFSWFKISLVLGFFVHIPGCSRYILFKTNEGHKGVVLIITFFINWEYHLIMPVGKGVHYCLGSPFARLESEIAFVGLFQRFPDLALD
jgi:hypothetical protein